MTSKNPSPSLPFLSKLSKRHKVYANTEGPSATKQSFKDECDINNILKKFKTIGQLPHVSGRTPMYGDFSNPITYQESLNIVIKAKDQFNALPSKVRDRFGNDPVQFLQFVNDEKNIPELIELGLATKKEPKQSPPAKAASDGGVDSSDAKKGAQK